jgi:hypothetical protein
LGVVGEGASAEDYKPSRVISTALVRIYDLALILGRNIHDATCI